MDLREVEVTRINVSDQSREQKIDFVAEDSPIHIFLNSYHYGTILCSPNQLKEMTVGHLLSEGLLESTEEIEALTLKEDGKCLVKLKPEIDAKQRISTMQRLSRIIVSACGDPNYRPLSEMMNKIAKLDRTLTVRADIISHSVQQLNTIAKKFRQTGGVHVAALYTEQGKLEALAEDVGRHNAVDKVIGAGALKELDFGIHFLASSGRLSGDIVMKASRMKIPIIASLSATISSGLEIAQLAKVTLVGFVRGKRMNVYTYPDRITFNKRN